MAISRVTNGVTNGTGTSLTLSLTVSGSNTIIWAAGFISTGVNLTALTYDGAALTHVTGSPFTVDSSNKIYLAYRVAPSAGTHDLAATFDNTGAFSLQGSVYAGALQTGVPDATNTSSIGVTSTPSQAVTTVADNAWAIWILRGTSGNSVTAGANTTLLNEYATYDIHLLDGGPKTPAGSFTLNANATSSAHYGIIASFAPAATSIKTVDGLAKASVKTVNGLAIASVGTINGLA